MPLVSVFMPAYNHERFIGFAIQSVLNQTFQNFELLILDDCSSDGTVEQIKKFSDPRIRFSRFSTNHGAAIAGNKLVEEARGKYVALLNSDDVFLPDKLEKQVRFLESHPEIGVVFGQAEAIDDEGFQLESQTQLYRKLFDKENRSRHEWLRYFFFEGNCLCHPTMLIRRECYERVGRYDPRMAGLADYDLWVRLLMSYEIAILPDVLIKLRILAGELNASAPRPDVLIGGEVERVCVLKHYLEIDNIPDLEQIFPQTKGQLKRGEEDLIPYVLAKLAMKVRRSSYQQFAIETLFNLMDNPEKAERVEKKFGYSFVSLIADARSFDIYNVIPDSSLLYINSGSGFNEDQVMIQKVLPSSPAFRIRFQLNGCKNIQSVKWYPVLKRFSRIGVKGIRVKQGDEMISLPVKSLNCDGYEEGAFMVFENTIPEFCLALMGEYDEIEFEGEWEVWDDQRIGHWMAAKLTELKQLRTEISKIKNSRWWTLTKPLR